VWVHGSIPVLILSSYYSHILLPSYIYSCLLLLIYSCPPTHVLLPSSYSYTPASSYSCPPPPAPGLLNVFARIGGMVAPQIASLSISVWRPISPLVFALFAFSGTAVLLLLPDTKGAVMYESLSGTAHYTLCTVLM
jgi:hypothetical protein